MSEVTKIGRCDVLMLDGRWWVYIGDTPLDSFEKYEWAVGFAKGLSQEGGGL